MKAIIILLFLMGFSPLAVEAQKYEHKSEAEIAAMTPAQRVDEYVDEHANHKFEFSDKQYELIEKYILVDGIKAFPRITEIIDEYDPTSEAGKSRLKALRFDGAWMILSRLDNYAVRARASEEGRRAIDALGRAIERMRAAGYGKPEDDGWEKSGRIGTAISELKFAKGINFFDNSIRDTFRLEYKIILPDDELLKFSDFLTTRHSDYPGWSKNISFRDYTRFNYAGSPFWVRTLRTPKRVYDAYLEFKKAQN